MSLNEIPMQERFIHYLQELIASSMQKEDIKLYTAAELAEKWNWPIEKIHLLRKYGALKAIKKGKDFGFPHKAIVTFLDDFNGQDLSNEKAIRFAVLQVEQKRKKAF